MLATPDLDASSRDIYQVSYLKLNPLEFFSVSCLGCTGNAAFGIDSFLDCLNPNAYIIFGQSKITQFLFFRKQIHMYKRTDAYIDRCIYIQTYIMCLYADVKTIVDTLLLKIKS